MPYTVNSAGSILRAGRPTAVRIPIKSLWHLHSYKPRPTWDCEGTRLVPIPKGCRVEFRVESGPIAMAVPLGRSRRRRILISSRRAEQRTTLLGIALAELFDA